MAKCNNRLSSNSKEMGNNSSNSLVVKDSRVALNKINNKMVKTVKTSNSKVAKVNLSNNNLAVKADNSNNNLAEVKADKTNKMVHQVKMEKASKTSTVENKTNSSLAAKDNKDNNKISKVKAEARGSKVNSNSLVDRAAVKDSSKTVKIHNKTNLAVVKAADKADKMAIKNHKAARVGKADSRMANNNKVRAAVVKMVKTSNSKVRINNKVKVAALMDNSNNRMITIKAKATAKASKINLFHNNLKITTAGKRL